MRRKTIRGLQQVDARIDELMIRLEDMRYGMDASEERDEINTILDHLQDARYALGSLVPETA